LKSLRSELRRDISGLRESPIQSGFVINVARRGFFLQKEQNILDLFERV
jgi:DNA-binding winged helix-turn-helix (wHTH) protein